MIESEFKDIDPAWIIEPTSPESNNFLVISNEKNRRKREKSKHLITSIHEEIRKTGIEIAMYKYGSILYGNPDAPMSDIDLMLIVDEKKIKTGDIYNLGKVLSQGDTRFMISQKDEDDLLKGVINVVGFDQVSIAGQLLDSKLTTLENIRQYISPIGYNERIKRRKLFTIDDLEQLKPCIVKTIDGRDVAIPMEYPKQRYSIDKALNIIDLHVPGVMTLKDADANGEIKTIPFAYDGLFTSELIEDTTSAQINKFVSKTVRRNLIRGFLYYNNLYDGNYQPIEKAFSEATISRFLNLFVRRNRFSSTYEKNLRDRYIKEVTTILNIGNL
ncbi:MAG TPA: hypothetical protein VLG12_01995 [Candidatus Saccharimonadales bacterium]|nr:hypothetical protein [Candidatus Saccharimonadales bacterium]